MAQNSAPNIRMRLLLIFFSPSSKQILSKCKSAWQSSQNTHHRELKLLSEKRDFSIVIYFTTKSFIVLSCQQHTQGLFYQQASNAIHPTWKFLARCSSSAYAKHDRQPTTTQPCRMCRVEQHTTTGRL